jgi:hypothetical protein
MTEDDVVKSVAKVFSQCFALDLQIDAVRTDKKAMLESLASSLKKSKTLINKSYSEWAKIQNEKSDIHEVLEFLEYASMT